MTDFEKAADAIKASGSKGVSMTNDELLKVYALFKQGSVGDVNTSRPGMLDFKGKSKWDAWNALKGKSQEEAQKEYVENARALLAKYKCDDLINF
jgi:diazepam-binding inhibitor (GABA receptor modulator, acyl-CoA-binding protein)